MRSPEAAKRAEPSEAARASKSSADRGAGTIAPGTLAIVSTPIGNLGDFSKRAAATLAAADVIACEDTRVTAKLLAAYGIETPMLAYHDHNAQRIRPQLLQRLRDGQIVGLVSDAGTPLISDPGYKLAAEAAAAGLAVTAVPGASALLSALVLSGLPSDRFFFAGFLPNRVAARRAEIRALASVPGTLIFYEAPSRVSKLLVDLHAVLGSRPAAVARELTKKFEEVRRGGLEALAGFYTVNPAPRGECVVLVGPPGQSQDTPPAESELDALLAPALSAHGLRDAVALVSAETGLPRRDVYARALKLRAGETEADGAGR